jgi:hypothetical protein
MKKKIVIRGKTPSDHTDIINFSGLEPGVAYIMTKFFIYPSTAIGTQSMELCAAVTAEKTYASPDNPNFNDDGLIATALYKMGSAANENYSNLQNIVNDSFLITQDLIISVKDATPGSPMDVNWHCEFEMVKMSKAESAVTNYKQFMIFDG